MITRIKIDGYKSFQDFELKMKPLMVLFGPNTSGKSNL
ncbi:MAG: AAA family ATPase, partial [bacterium]